MSKDWYLSSSSNYLSGWENEEFSANKYEIFKEILANSPETYNVSLNDKPVDVIIQTTQDSEVKKVITVLGLLNRGDLILYDNSYWLVNSRPTDNKMNDSATMKQCNSSIKLTTGDIQVDTGKINEITGKPIKKLVPGENIEIPCVFERTVSVNGSDQPINLPDGQAHITLPYSTNPQLKIGLKTQFYSEEYIVHDIDYSKVIDGVGTIKLIAKKKVSDTK
ncbi:hypothetical protein [Bacillus safensis]|uniref:hypothetical protein n=1 Tax=Bacillus safensis TaxID=561879 RepID=UPI0020CF2BAE|nr:hypothetical protein [Bacillus safensis]MCP9283645.1 hypothetical protein [Bacillus safensis]